MSFWSQLNSDPRRFRPTTTTNSSSGGRNSNNLFRDTSPAETDMFFDTSHHNMTFPRSNLAERWGSSVFDDFPSRRIRTSFSADPSSSAPFESLRRHRRWMNGDQSPEGGDRSKGRERGSESREASPASSESGNNNTRQHSFHHGAIPVRVAQGSRSSTPESTGSGSAASGRSAESANEMTNTLPPNGVEEHPMANSKPGQPSFTAKRTPKVHHIPIHVEPRDGPHPVTLTPPIVHDTPTVDSATTSGFTVGTPGAPNPTSGPAFQTSSRQNEQIPSDVPLKTTERVIPIKVMPNEPKMQTKSEATAPRRSSENATPPLAKSDPKRKTATEIVEEVRVDVERLRKIVSEYNGLKGSKDYLFLDEMLTRNLIRLDNIETDGNDELRQARRAAVAAVHQCICCLEQQAQSKAVEKNAETSAVDVEPEEAAIEIQSNAEREEATTVTQSNDAPIESDSKTMESDEPIQTAEPDAIEKDMQVDDVEPVHEAGKEPTDSIEAVENGSHGTTATCDEPVPNQQETTVSS